MKNNSLRRRHVAVIVAALAVMIGTTPALLFAHAHLVRSAPAANTAIEAPLKELRLWFSERPEPRFTSIQLLDSAGTPIPLGSVAAIADNGIVVPVTGAVGPGRYSVVWHTAAADGHATNGKFAFTVRVVSGATPAAPAATAGSAPPAGLSVTIDTQTRRTSQTNAVVYPSSPAGFSTAMHWAELMAVLTMIGAVTFRLAVLPPANWTAARLSEASDRSRRLAQAALVLFIITTCMRIVAQSALLPNVGGGRWNAVVTVARDTGWGHGWAIGAAGAIIAVVGFAAARATLAGWIAAAAGVIAMCLGEALTGHTATSSHFALATATDLVHFLAAGGWLGGLTAVLLSGFPSLHADRESDGPAAGMSLVRSYHKAALECVTLALLSAIIMAWLRLGGFTPLWTSTYGRILLLKIAAVIILLGFGWYHWKRVVRVDWVPDTMPRFRRTAAAELLVGAVVVGITAVLVSTSLPT